jgi:hypothetical protein
MHADRVFDVLSGPVNRERRRSEVRAQAEREYDARTQRELDRTRSPVRQQQVLAERQAAREQAIQNRVEREGTRDTQLVSRSRSATVMSHQDGTVSIGLSGGDPERSQSARSVAAELNHRYPTDPPTYRAAQGAVPLSQLSRVEQQEGRAAHPDPGICSEPHAATAASESSSQPVAFQTVWLGRGNQPTEHQLPGRPRIGGTGPELMRPCATCQLNAPTYNQMIRG